MLEIVPPLPLPPTAVLAPSPLTVKLPVRFCTTMPLAPPAAEILRNDSVPLLPAPPMLTAVPVVVVRSRIATVTPATLAPLRPVAVAGAEIEAGDRHAAGERHGVAEQRKAAGGDQRAGR